MKQLFRALVVAVLLAAVGPVGALGLGKLEKNSSLNERFNGRIPLVSVSADEISTLQVGLADESAFKRADVVYSPVLRDLKFELVEPKTGPDYIQITSNKPIREPFLNFLVELNWASGRIFREYTVLLDPPLYDSQQQSASTAAPGREAPASGVSQEGHQVNYPEDAPARQRPAAPSPAYSGGDYGPTRSGDTLWSIANEMKPASITTHQMMLALLRANPDAFIGNNINGLKRGAILQMPDRQQMNAVSQSEALAQVKNQHGLWEGARQAMAAEPTQRADTATAAPAADATATAGETGGESGSRLELVGTEEGATGQTGDAEGSGQTAEKLAIANENLESLRQENAELKDRLAQNEALIEDLKRLIALKNDELASLQGRTAEEAAAPESTAPAGQVEMVEGVNYPSGDPSQFISETTGEDELLPGPVPPEEPVSHTVNRPEAGGDAPAAPAETAGDQAADTSEKAATQPAAEAESKPAQPAPTDVQPTAAGGGIVDMLMGYVAAARGFLMNNLMIVGAVLLAIIAVLAGSTYMRRRQARIEEEADASMASGTFPDFNADDDADQTSFEDDAESATELNAATATAADDDATEIATGSASEAADDADDDLFVVPQGEQEPHPSAEDDDEDPLAEVNVLMAYEHFDQAESFVRNALKSEPNNVEYQAKLLEVFYAAGNKKKYEEAASDLRDMTGGEGEHWDMAVAMWQEMSPNRALFEGGGDEEDEQAADSTGGGGIVDITGDTAGGDADATSDTGGGLDFDLGDSTGGGSTASSDDDSGMLDITASEEASASDDMLDLTAAESSSSDDDMLDMTAATSQVDDDDTMFDMTAAGSLEANQTEEQSGSDSSENDDFEFSLGDDDQSEGDLLDVTQSGNVESDEDLLDVTSSSQATQSGAGEDDDSSLDFSLDMDSDSDNEFDSEAMTAPGTTPAAADDASAMDDIEAEFDLDSGDSGGTSEASTDSVDASDNAFDFDLDIGESDSTGEEQAAGGSDEAKSDSDNSFDMDLEIQEDGDSNDLDEIGDELDRLEQTLGTLSRKENQDATKGFGSNTSDALEGIDSALEDMETELGEESGTDTASGSGEADDGGLEVSLDDDTGSDDNTESADELDLSLDGVQSDDNDDFSDFNLESDTTAESGKDSDDTSSVSLEGSDDDDFSDFDLDFGNEEDNAAEAGKSEDDGGSVSLDSGDDDLTSDLSEFDFDLDSDSGSDDLAGSNETADSDISAELSEISQELDSGDLESAGDNANESGGMSMDFDLDTGESSGSGGDLEIDMDDNAAANESSDDTQTMQMNVAGDGGDETDFSSELDLDLSADDMSANDDANESIDMDSTVELPKDKLSGGLSLSDDEEQTDDNDDEDSTLFVGRSSDTEEQSLEDELTTKLDLAKAYVELGDSDSARGILEEVMKDGNDDQKRQAGELLGQL